MTIAAVVLAAGFSRRLGRAKQHVVLGGESLIERTLRIAAEAQLFPLIVVTRSEHGLLFPQAHNVFNPEAGEGMASSARIGVLAAEQQGAQGLVLLTCDQPLLTAAHLQALIAEPQRITGSAYAGRTGVPAFFPAKAFSELKQLRGDVGARDLLRTAFAVACEDLALDIDTEEDLQRATQRMGQ